MENLENKPLFDIEAKSSNLTRLELLAVLEYLLKYSDELHPTSAGKVHSYALNEYGIDIKTSRITEIMDFLAMYSLKKDLYLFKIIKFIPFGKQYPKYYKKCNITDTSFINRLVTSFKNTYNENSDTNMKEDVDAFFSLFLSKNETKEDKTKLIDLSCKSLRLPDKDIVNYTKLADGKHIDRLYRLKLFKSKINLKDKPLEIKNYLIVNDYEIDVYLYDCYQLDTCLIGYFLSKKGELFRLNLSYFDVMYTRYSSNEEKDKVQQLFYESHGQTIEEFLKENFNKYTNPFEKVYDIVFYFDEENCMEVEKPFYNFLDTCKEQYKSYERKAIVRSAKTNNIIEKRNVIAINYRSDLNNAIRFFGNTNYLKYITINQPQELKDYINAQLSSIAKRLK